MRLNWGLVVCTYKREHILPRCLERAAAQTRPPSEAVILDASPDWEKTRDRVLCEAAAKHPGVRWRYIKAERASLTAQRNQGIRLATADVLFLIDDDSLLYPDCAEQVMRVYEADTRGAVAGVGPVEVATPPDVPAQTAPSPAGAAPAGLKKALLARLENRITAVEHIFLPYDGDYPARAVPPELAGLNVGVAPLFNGFRMTFRRAVLEQERFEEALERYCASEDLDISYRISRRGVLLNAFDARVFHAKAPGGRLSRETVAMLTAMNIAALHRLHAGQPDRSRKRYARYLRRRLMVELMADFSRRRWSLPQARGVLMSMRYARDIFGKSREELREWYPRLQRDLIARDEGRGGA